MMGTLIRQEYLTTRKALLSIGGWVLIAGVISIIPVAIPFPFVKQFGLLVGLVAFLALTPVLFGYLVVQYWQSMYGARGYFTLSLPVRGREIYWAKTLYMLAVTAMGILGSAVGLVVLGGALDIGRRESVGTTVRAVLDAVFTQRDVIGPMAFILAVQFILCIFAIPATLSISAQTRFNHLGIGAAFIGVFLLYVVYEVSALVAMLFLPLGISLTGSTAGHVVAQGMWDDVVAMASDPNLDRGPAVLGIGMLVTTLILTGVVAWRGIHAIEEHTSLR